MFNISTDNLIMIIESIIIIVLIPLLCLVLFLIYQLFMFVKNKQRESKELNCIPDGYDKASIEPWEYAENKQAAMFDEQDEFFNSIFENQDFDRNDLSDKSLLKKMGYRVGKNGYGFFKRQKIIKDAIEYQGTCDEWYRYGKACTQRRTEYIMTLLSRLIESRTNHSYDYSESIDDWQHDLEWIRKTYCQDESYWK